MSKDIKAKRGGEPMKILEQSPLEAWLSFWELLPEDTAPSVEEEALHEEVEIVYNEDEKERR